MKKATTADQRRKLARDLRIKPKTAAMVDLLQANPKLSQADAYLMTHKTDSKKNAGIQASKLLKKDSVQIYANNAVNKAKKKMVSLIDSDNESIALRASTDVINRTHGLPVSKQEITSKSIEVKLDLTGVKLGNHYLQKEV